MSVWEIGIPNPSASLLRDAVSKAESVRLIRSNECDGNEVFHGDSVSRK